MREKILNLAMAQLKAGGYESLNFAKIAEALSTTRPNIHYHFKNKEGLAFEVTKIYAAKKLEMMQQLAQANAGNFPGFLADLEEILITQINTSNGTIGCVCNQMIKEINIPSHLKAVAQTNFDEVCEVFHGLIKDSQAAGTISKIVDPESLAFMTQAMIMGIVQVSLTKEDPHRFTEKIKGTLVNWVRLYSG